MFDRPYSGTGTVVLCFLFGLAIFVIATLLGLFVDPCLSVDTRSRIVLGWGMTTPFVVMATVTIRHN